MAYIQGILYDEYERLARKLANYLSKPLNPQREEAIASIRTDMEFIEKAFKANGVELPPIV